MPSQVLVDTNGHACDQEVIREILRPSSLASNEQELLTDRVQVRRDRLHHGEIESVPEAFPEGKREGEDARHVDS